MRGLFISNAAIPMMLSQDLGVVVASSLKRSESLDFYECSLLLLLLLLLKWVTTD